MESCTAIFHQLIVNLHVKNIIWDKAHNHFMLQLLKRQAEEIDVLVKNMKEEHEELRSTYREELEEIENALMEVIAALSNTHSLPNNS